MPVVERAAVRAAHHEANRAWSLRRSTAKLRCGSVRG